MQNNLSSSRGFTLAELLVVIAIISVLSAIVLVNVGPARQDARDAQRQTDISQISIALKLYREHNGSYPNYDGEIDSSSTVYSALENFMEEVPTDPLNDPEHYYYYNSNHQCDPGPNGPVVFARSLESKDGNLNEVCPDGWGSQGGASTSTNPYIIMLR
ncbi:MAG: prepilin-type N-terminal cleavage/methylation domain-containing protein [Candidatus Campbellbacteria bacterium]|nr:prepilin-type N-terminal cleavage/methylation domain-containing protein [Candidatus Campbellbacteria bacterium]